MCWCMNVDGIVKVWCGGGRCVIGIVITIVVVAWWCGGVYVFWLEVVVVYECGCGSNGGGVVMVFMYTVRVVAVS